MLYLDRVEAPWPWRLTLDVGAHVPLHCTASGKLFLASMTAARRDALIERPRLEALTPTTITSPEQLRAECDAIAARGYSTDREEFIAGLNAAAVPVKDAQGQTRRDRDPRAERAHVDRRGAGAAARAAGGCGAMAELL